MPTRFLGYDGLWTDETAARYTSDGSGNVIREHWGTRETITPHAALDELKVAHQNQEHCKSDPHGTARLKAIDRAIANVEALIELESTYVQRGRNK